MRIVILTSSHFSFDDRIYYHIAATLDAQGHDILIVSSKEELQHQIKNIKIDSFNGNSISKKEKIDAFIKKMDGFIPDRIIVSEPLVVWASVIYKKKSKNIPQIIYDITEWYPSKKNLFGLSQFKSFFVFLKLLGFNYFVSFFVDKFIFGEFYKSVPFRFFFPFKPFVFLSYYPNLTYFNPQKCRTLSKNINLSYSGKLTKEKGFDCFLEVVKELSILAPKLEINIKIIGWYVSENEEVMYKKIIYNLSQKIIFEYYKYLPFLNYLDTIKDTDIFLDLREGDIENQHCLPIKLFYYLGFKRPVIYTNLKAIRKEVDINKIGYLVEDKNTESIAKLILNLINDNELYQKHCIEAEKVSLQKYNWKLIEENLILILK